MTFLFIFRDYQNLTRTLSQIIYKTRKNFSFKILWPERLFFFLIGIFKSSCQKRRKILEGGGGMSFARIYLYLPPWSAGYATAHHCRAAKNTFGFKTLQNTVMYSIHFRSNSLTFAKIFPSPPPIPQFLRLWKERRMILDVNLMDQTEHTYISYMSILIKIEYNLLQIYLWVVHSSLSYHHEYQT